MKRISAILFILTLLCQIAYPQRLNEGIVKSFYLRVDKTVEAKLDNANTVDALITQLKIPANYEFKHQITKGTGEKMRERDDLGYVHERYAQYYKGIKIEHSDIRVRYLNDLFVSANGEYIDVPNIDISFVLSKEKAIEKAKEYIGAKKYMWEDEAENNWLKNTMNDKLATFYPNPELVICKNSIDFPDTTFYVAYKIDIYAKEPISRDYVFVDAKNGNILAANPILVNATGAAATRYSGTRSISTEQNVNSFRLRAYDNNRSIETYNMNRGANYFAAVDFTDNDNDWTAVEYHNANRDDGALDAHWAAMMTYDYFKNVHNRNSYDNNGAVLRNYVHANLTAMGYLNNDNAFWDGLRMTYGDGTFCDILTPLDIVAHEIGHGICEYTANLIYEGESGAINESLSDIWGVCVEHYAAPNKQIWLMGEDIGCIVRSISNPKLFNQPNTYEGTYWYNQNNCTPNMRNDYCGVHTNSGVMNYWFYLLSIGGNGTNDKGNTYNVVGIDIDKAAKIVYRAENYYMTSNTNFNSARTLTIQAAIDMYESCSSEVVAVTNAWHAVGIGGISTEQRIISNITYTTNTTITDCNVVLKDVNVQNNAKLTISNAKEVTINGTFEIALDSELEIQ